MLFLFWQPSGVAVGSGYILNGTRIKSPTSFDESRSSVMALMRTMSGNVNADYFSQDSRVWNLEYVNCSQADYNTIANQYNQYLSSGTILFEVIQNNYVVAETRVHVDLVEQSFVKGSDYRRNFNLILTEA